MRAGLCRASTSFFMSTDKGVDARDKRRRMTSFYAVPGVRYSAACRGARASRTSASSGTVWIGVKSRCAM